METVSGNENTRATAIKKQYFMKILQSFSFISLNILFCKFSLSVAMSTNQIQRFGQKMKGLLKEHFCKTFVKISAVIYM